MLQVLFFYMFVWWFKKLENKKGIIIRAVLAGIIGVFFWITAFASISMIMFEAALVVVVIVGFGVAILFTIRFFCDINQIRKLNDIEKPKTTSGNTDTKPHDFIHG